MAGGRSNIPNLSAASIASTEDTLPTPDPSIPKPRIGEIKNKIRRAAEYVKFKRERNKAKEAIREKRRKEAARLGKDAPPKQQPRTLESTREKDETMVDRDDEEIKLDESVDEFASYFNKDIEPKVLITASENSHVKTNHFIKELSRMIPNSTVKFRANVGVKKLVSKCTELGFTDIIVINEDRRKPNAMLLIHLPEGPTAYFRLSNVKYRKQIKGVGELTNHRPEVILNNFNTRLGHTVGRMLGSLFHYDPEFRGRKVVTFHNQRDYIFFRHHRYQFRNAKKVGLHELGPRFTLRLKSLQKGTFDTKFGEFEWLLKRHEMETSRRRFFL